VEHLKVDFGILFILVVHFNCGFIFFDWTVMLFGQRWRHHLAFPQPLGKFVELYSDFAIKLIETVSSRANPRMMLNKRTQRVFKSECMKS